MWLRGRDPPSPLLTRLAFVGLGTASRSRVLTRHRSDVLIQLASETVHSLPLPHKKPAYASSLCGSGAGIRTLDQWITCIHTFPHGMDYIFSDPCRSEALPIKRADCTPRRDSL